MKMETQTIDLPMFPLIRVAAVAGERFPLPAPRTTPPTRTTPAVAAPRLTVREAAARYQGPQGVAAVVRYQAARRAAGVELSVLEAYREIVRNATCSA